MITGKPNDWVKHIGKFTFIEEQNFAVQRIFTSCIWRRTTLKTIRRKFVICGQTDITDISNGSIWSCFMSFSGSSSGKKITSQLMFYTEALASCSIFTVNYARIWAAEIKDKHKWNAIAVFTKTDKEGAYEYKLYFLCYKKICFFSL